MCPLSFLPATVELHLLHSDLQRARRLVRTNMDPLSITAGIVSVGTVAASTARAFKELRELCKTLPGRLHALSNEVSDIELVLYQVASVVEKRTGDSALKEEEAHM